MNTISTLLSYLVPGYLDKVLKGGAGDIILNAGPMVQFVLIILLFFSIISWAIIFSKFKMLRRADRESNKFLDFFWKNKKLLTIYEESKKTEGNPIAEVFRAGYIELSKLNKVKYDSSGKETYSDVTSISTELGGIDNISRALNQAVISQTNKLEKTLPFLATTGNTSPFIGLFGTVWGIMDAFRGIGIKGSASLAVVAPGISEALIATAAGLAAAIPAVIAYNYYLNKIRVLTSYMENFSSEFLNIIERHLYKK
ncbi:MAG: protein TolQ [Pseudomonadota bacterium]